MLAVACAAVLAAAPPAAAGGGALVEAAAGAPATVVATVRDGEALDARAWLAVLEVERALSGPHAAGDRVAVAWDERTVGRPRRLPDGARVLVALAPLPGWSIWRERLGGREATGIAARGEAWLRDPDETTVALLADWLAHPPEARGTAAALPDLAALVAGAEPSVARGALERIDALPGLASALAAADAARGALAGALADPGRPEALRSAILGLVARRDVASLAPAVAALAAPGSPLAPDAIVARAALGDGLPPEEARALAARPEPAVRAAVVTAQPERLPDATLEGLAFRDDDAAVRAAALAAWVARHGIAALPRVGPWLDDPNTAEGAAVVRALGALGEPAVAPLARRAAGRDLAGARGPLLALSLAGPPGAAALRELAATHEDAAVRGFAAFLLGRAPRDH